MSDTHIDRILENLSAVLPVFHKKLLKMNLGGVTGDLTRLHLGIMGMLREGSLPVSELARMTVIPKPQMTRLIDQLVKAGIVERRADSADRRVINIALTEYGRVLAEDVKRKVQESIRTDLAGLAPEELAEMAKALEALRRIVAKL
ncbi:MAG: hypothetical protein A2147_07005 [Chloroflexi bacterium RBG_16_57_8]|nr:MAG: hypothetical protein A2147_07005 [Chloroflexi bacterium RBG_16_57_8]